MNVESAEEWNDEIGEGCEREKKIAQVREKGRGRERERERERERVSKKSFRKRQQQSSLRINNATVDVEREMRDERVANPGATNDEKRKMLMPRRTDADDTYAIAVWERKRKKTNRGALVETAEETRAWKKETMRNQQEWQSETMRFLFNPWQTNVGCAMVREREMREACCAQVFPVLCSLDPRQTQTIHRRRSFSSFLFSPLRYIPNYVCTYVRYPPVLLVPTGATYSVTPNEKRPIRMMTTMKTRDMK